MLNLNTYISTFNKMGLSFNDIAIIFMISPGTISNWRSGTVINNYRVPTMKLIQGTKGCRKQLKKDADTFTLDLINFLDISVTEKSFLHTKYKQLGFEDFIPYLVRLAVDQVKFVPATFDYEQDNILRPIVGVGQDHAVAVSHNGHVRATGTNDEKQCSTIAWRDVVSVVGTWKGTIGLHADGTCVATGLDVVGDGDIFRWTNIESLAAGTFHFLGLRSDETVLSYGRNPFGQCNVSEWKNIKGIAAGTNHSVGLFNDGSVIAVGKNDRGQCDVKDWKNVKQVVASADHTLALLNDGTVIGCGYLGGIKLDSLQGAVAIATGEQHAVGLMENGCVVNTGADISGLSDVERWHNMVSISAGFATTIGVRADGRVFVTHDKHKSFYLDTDSWKLFDNKDAGQMQSKFDKCLSEYKRMLLSVQEQALRVSPYVSEYHDNMKILDFALFPDEYEKLKKLSADIFAMYEPSESMPTIHNIVQIYLGTFCEMANTVEEKDGKPCLTEQTYQAFFDLLFAIQNLLQEIRLIEEGMSLPELAEQQLSDFSPWCDRIPPVR